VSSYWHQVLMQVRHNREMKQMIITQYLYKLD